MPADKHPKKHLKQMKQSEASIWKTKYKHSENEIKQLRYVIVSLREKNIELERKLKQFIKSPITPAPIIISSSTPASLISASMCLGPETSDGDALLLVVPRRTNRQSLQPVTPPTPMTSNNEFESDNISLPEYATAVDDQFQHTMNDILRRFQGIREDKLHKTMMNEPIIFDSRFKLFSSSADGYMESAGMLTKNQLYLISAINHQIWTEFAARTKIDQLILDENDNDKKITADLAQKLVHNLDIVDDEKINADIEAMLVNKTKKELKLDILLHEKPIESLAWWFPVLHETLQNRAMRAQRLKEVNCIIIENFYTTSIIAEAEQDDFLESVLQTIAYADQQRSNKDIVIRLQRYYTRSTIASLTQRVSQWLKKQADEYLNNPITIVAHDDTIKIAPRGVMAADIKWFANLHTDDDGCGLTLDVGANKHDSGGHMWCSFENKNLCQEWLTHLDFVMNSDSEPKRQVDERRGSFSDKLMNDFTETDFDRDHFGFGAYIDFWSVAHIDSANPKYATLKDELCTNKIAGILESDYYELYRECVQLMRQKRHRILASDIGINNKRFHISKGSPITVNHLIALKLMTDFTDVQNAFKKTCRKQHANESIAELIARNSECANWCRYIKEACTFYGKLLKKKKNNMVLYTGLDTKLLFSSMKQNFECPISTTLSMTKAQSFCEDDGLILKLKAANTRTRYFDVSWLSRHPKEEERLIMGSSMEICDIFVNGKSAINVFDKPVFSAFSLFERLANGQFVKNDIDVERTLFDLLTNTLKATDAAAACSQYIPDLFANLVKEMQGRHDRGQLWWSKEEISKLQHEPLRNLFNDPQQYVPRFQLKADRPIRWVKQYEWRIAGLAYERFNKSQPRQYLVSDHEYLFENPMATISFQLKCCAKYSEESDKTALFLHITKMQPHVQSVLIGYDILCGGLGNKKNYEHSIVPQWMHKEKLHCGLQLFSSKRLNAETSITWKIALRIIDVKYAKQKSY